ncbi:MAG: UbiA family prenyltransferase [Planctomycetia bacterium]|nr:UbiA family prenyltransferase [Planctomycetia bacterium]
MALRAYLQLFRLPNVFTALADVLLGFFFIFNPAAQPPWGQLALLLSASALLYTSGMVLNDVFDADVDAIERPERPIPSGRIDRAWARQLGFSMLLAGAGLGWIASQTSGQLRPGIVATALALLVVLYDTVLKRTPIAPLVMGSCRFCNVLLGMSVAAAAWVQVHYVVAAGIGLYVAGVTWFAKTEAHRPNRALLVFGMAVMAAGLALVAAFPLWSAGQGVALFRRIFPTWYYLMAVVGAIVLARCLRAVVSPSPQRVQEAVKISILSLILLDAAACLAVRGPYVGMAIALLIVPAMFLGRWIYST